VDRQDRVVVAERPAVVDDLLGPPLDLGVATLHRVEVELRRVGTGRHRRRRATTHADPHARPTELHEQRARREGHLLASATLIVPRPPALMIGLW
jgi:hypothetical protein